VDENTRQILALLISTGGTIAVAIIKVRPRKAAADEEKEEA